MRPKTGHEGTFRLAEVTLKKWMKFLSENYIDKKIINNNARLILTQPFKSKVDLQKSKNEQKIVEIAVGKHVMKHFSLP